MRLPTGPHTNKVSRGGKFWCTDFKGGHVFSAPTLRGGKISVRRNLGIPLKENSSCHVKDLQSWDAVEVLSNS